MTDEEKAAAAKAEQTKKKEAEGKKAENKESESDEDEDDDAGDEDDDSNFDAASAKERIKKLNEENKKRRLKEKENAKRVKELEEKDARNSKALAILQGKKDGEGTVDPLEAAQEKANSKLRNALLKGTIAGLAKDAHEPNSLYRMFPDEFADIDVDLDTESVDEEQVAEKLKELREKKSYLFAKEDANGGNGNQMQVPPKKGNKLPPNGPPANGQNHLAVLKQLQSQNRHDDANEYYKKHHVEIKAQLKGNPNLLR